MAEIAPDWNRMEQMERGTKIKANLRVSRYLECRKTLVFHTESALQARGSGETL